MITEEPSEQLTPLPEEHAEPPATVQYQQVPAETPQTSTRWLAWFDVGKAVLLWVISVVLLLFVPVVVALPYLVYRIVKIGPLTADVLATDKTLIFLSVAGILPTHLLTFLAIWLFVTEGRKRPFWKTIGFEWPRNTGPVISSLLSLLVAFVLLLLAWLATNLWGGNKTQLDLLIESSLPARFATAFVAVATAPLIEELIYRGVLYPAIERAAGMGVAIATVSLLFAGVHVFQYINNIAVITVITLLSITLTVVRAATRKVLPCFLIHLVFNGIQSVILVLAPYMDKGTG